MVARLNAVVTLSKQLNSKSDKLKQENSYSIPLKLWTRWDKNY